MDRAELDAALLRAHETENLPALIQLYTAAADAEPNVDAACFYLTHAYVFALQADAPDRVALNARLVAHGREERLIE